MFSTLTTLMIILSLVFGGGGATLAAAQTSQPDQFLYGIKTLSEDLRLGLAAEPQAEYQLALEFADRRAAEIGTLAQAGSTLPETVQTRYQAQVEQAIRSAAALGDQQAVIALEQVRARLQTQQNEIARLNSQSDATMEQVRQMLQDRLHWVEEGIQNPAVLRTRLNRLEQERLRATPHPTLNAQGTGYPGPKVTGTPVSGSATKTGPGGCTTCTPPATPPGGPNPQGTPTGMGPKPTMMGASPQPTHVGPGPQSTPVGPQSTPVGPQSTPVGPGPQQTPIGPMPTQAGPGPQPTHMGPGSQATPAGPKPTMGGTGGRP